MANQVILKNVKPFNKIYFKSCFYNSLFSVIWKFEKTIIPFFINDVIVYTGSTKKNGKFGVEYHSISPMQELLAEMGIGMNTMIFSHDVIRDLKKSLSQERPVVLWIDCFYSPIRPDKFMKEHWPHSLLVYGFNDEAEVFHVIEHTHPENLDYTQKTISYSDIVNAYHGFNHNFQDGTDLSFNDFYCDGTIWKSPTALQEAVSRFKHNVLIKKEVIVNGVNQLSDFAKEFRNIVSLESILRDRAEDILGSLNDIVNAKQVERYKLQHFWSNESEILLTVEKIIENWNFVRGMVAKFLYSSIYRPKDFERANQALEHICELENHYCNTLFALCDSSVNDIETLLETPGTNRDMPYKTLLETKRSVSQYVSKEEYVAPKNEIEKHLVKIWREVLEVDEIGINDDFFGLGGHSLKAILLISRIYKEMNVDLPLKQIFETPTIEKLAVCIQETEKCHFDKTFLIRQPSYDHTTVAPFYQKESPLSYFQEQLWFINELDPGNPAYINFKVFRLVGPLDLTALEKSVREIVRRHEVLRTSFHKVDGKPVQRIADTPEISIPVMDIRGLPVAMKDAEVNRLIAEEIGQSFDLSCSSLLTTKLIQLDNDEHVFIVMMPYIVSDEESMKIFIRELLASYQAFTGGLATPLPELVMQYSDFAHWQRESLKGEILEKQLTYWKQQLRGAPPLLELPTDHPRPAVQSFRGATESFLLSRSLTEDIKSLAQQEKVTLFITLLAAFKILLYRYTEQEDILVGSPITGRNRRETESLIGFFANSLVLRTSLSGDPSFLELLTRVRELCFEAFAHQDLSFEKLVEELQPERSLSHNPLCQVMFVLQNASMPKLEVPGLTLTSKQVDMRTAKFDITLTLEETEEGFKGSLNYNTDLFEASTINRMIGHFQNLLESIVANPDQRISELPLLTEAERQQLLVEWNETQADYPQNKCIHQVFEEQVERTPDALALIYEDRQLTYHDLNNHANQLAHYLQKLGVGPETLVGICLERSVEMAVGILAILKAGGAYVPLDPTYPTHRLEFMLQDINAPIILTEKLFLTKLQKQNSKVISLDTDWSIISQECKENLDTNVTANSLAYVIYTSGSTGKPKGVMNVHRGILNRLMWMQNTYRLQQHDRVLQKTPFTFDVSVWEFFWPWLNGACLVMARPEGHKDSAYLVDLINNREITIIHFVPSMLQVFLDQSAVESCSSLQRVFCSGESLPVELQKRFFSRLNAQLHNLYGPTEAAIDVTSWQCDPLNNRNIVPIGRPIANTQIYILDKFLQPVPIGVAGELHIGGVGLARGYWNRPDLTSEKFFPNPFDGDPESRLYKTGDLARYRPDGNIEFIGRLDNQVKIRGFRVELGEIETILTEHPLIQETVVVISETSGHQRLIAYIISKKQASAPSVHELQEFLKTKLPIFMIPSTFITLEAFPLTPNGKVDRRALPEPDARSFAHESAIVSPRTPTEVKLAEIWIEMLGMDSIGVHDNFFNLGGHSLLATQLLSRVYKVFKVELPLRDFFESPTLESLAKRIETTILSREHRNEVLLRRIPRDGELMLSYAQKRLWFIEQLDPGKPTYNIPMAISLKGDLDVSALERSFNELIRRHDSLRTRFLSVDGNPYQVVDPTITITMPVVDFRDVPGEVELKKQVLELANADANQPFDLTRSPLIRVILFQIAEKDYLLYLCIHHIIFDGWSMGILVRELAALYEAFTNDQPSSLSELTIQYPDFAFWQNQWLEGDTIQKQLAYWKQQLSGKLPVLQLPTDNPRPAVSNGVGRRDSITISDTLRKKLYELCKRESVTLFMVLLAAYKVLLNRYTGQEDILVGTPVANRTRVEFEGIVGFFVNTIVLRTDLSKAQNFRELLKQTRDVSIGAFSNQDVPFEKIVEMIQPERALNHTPIFQTMFTLQNMPMAEFKLSDDTMAKPEIDRGASLFDLSLEIGEEDYGLLVTAEYNMDLFNTSTIFQMLGHYQRILEQVVLNPDVHIRSLQMLSEEEQFQILHQFNDTKTDFKNGKTVHQMFEEQVKKTPHTVAIQMDTQTITYLELNKRSNKLARYLQKQGITTEDLVAVLLDRSPLMVECILSIWKARAAYIPIDPMYPPKRIAEILHDSGAKVLLSHSQFITPDLVDEWAGTILPLETLQPVISLEDHRNLELPLEMKNLAYVIYTSGSTGKPKGAMVEHIGMINHMEAKIVDLKISETSVIAQNASHCFDISIWQFFAALVVGGKTIIYDNELAMNPVKFITHIAQDQVTILEVVPSVLSVILEYLEDNAIDLRTLRYLIVTGETLKSNLVKKWFALYPGIQMVNAYGPTEASDDITHYFMVKVPETETVPIGKPLHNFKIYIVDDNMNLCPVGVKGEICVAGIGVGRGYLNDSERTMKVFMEDPFSNEKGVRLYKTGDLGRWLPDGTIEFFGRKDYQVKIRGFRIELGEIENRLVDHPDIRDAAVTDLEDASGNKHLCAYVVLRKDSRITDIRKYLFDHLPDYMVPSYFVKLNQLPLTTNGKVDRNALPRPEEMENPDTHYTAPKSEIEEKLVDIWRDVLNVKRIGVLDNFFEHGGHSLRATVLVSQINKQLNVEVPLREIFKTPTIRDLAKYIESREKSDYSPIVPIEHMEHYAVSSSQKRMLILNQQDEENLTYNMPIVLRIEGNMSKERLETSFRKLVVRHESLRTSFSWVEGHPIQRIHKNVEFVMDRLDAGEEEVEQLIKSFIRPFDLNKVPLFRIGLLKLSSDLHILIFDVHHILTDGVSMVTLLRELFALYRGDQLPPLRIQYKDFSEWQRKMQKSEEMKKQESYWLKVFSGEIPALNLPTDFPRTSVQSYLGDEVILSLDREQSLEVKKMATEHGMTLYMMLLAAFSVLLAKYSAQEDIIIGMPVAGRRHADLDKVVGMFVNVLPIRNYPASDKTFKGYLEEVKQNVLHAFDNQDYQLEQLVAKLNLDREPGRNPLFDVVFVMQNFADGQMRTEPFQVNLFNIQTKVSKFDLQLTASEKDDQITLSFEYRRSLFTKETIESISNSFKKLLSIAAKDTSLKIKDIALEDRYELLGDVLAEGVEFSF